MPQYRKFLRKTFKYDDFQNNQRKIIHNILHNKKDICVVMYTGAGKSLCYQYPPIYSNKVAFVITPLISLMNDQKKKLDSLNINSICLNSTISNKNLIKQDILNNKYRLIYTTPEYIVENKSLLKELYNKKLLILIAIDESHCISSWGNDFRPSYRNLNFIKNDFENVPIIALTATATIQVKKDIIKCLQLKDPLVITTTFNRPNLHIKVLYKSTPEKDIIPLIDKGSSIIYCQTRKETKTISDILKHNNVKCESYHAGMKAFERELVYEMFCTGEIKCIVATIAFGMGIDQIIRTVIHYGRPKDMESYYQEIGRAGRDGKPSNCYLFYSLTDTNTNNFFITNVENKQYRDHKITLATIMNKYIYSNKCRRNYILEYFGEKTDTICNNCDNCLNENDIITMNFAKNAFILMKAIYNTDELYGITNVINVVRGINNKSILKFKNLDIFGAGKQYSNKWWKLLSRLLININFIQEYTKKNNKGFSLKLTKLSRKWMMIYIKNNKTELILPIPEEMKDILQPSKKTTSSKKNSTEIVYKLFHNENKSIKEITKITSFSKMKVEYCIEKMYKENKPFDLHKVGFTNDIYKVIKDKIIELQNPDKLKIIKNALPANITYLQIKLTLLKMKI